MKVSVIGTGYVGLTTGTMLAEYGHQVTCVDIDADKIKLLNNASVPFFEPGLEKLVGKHFGSNLKFTTELHSLPGSKVILIAVGTPPAKDGSPDLSYVISTIRGIIPYLRSYKVIIMKSTVPVGTNKIIRDYLLDQGVDKRKFDIVSNPEFLREGMAIQDSFYPDRIVIGSDSQKAALLTYSLYQQAEAPVIITSNETAEMIKYASNAFLATKISFVNELADICEKYGVNINDVAKGVGYDKRIGPHFLKAGAGYGGSCLPKDLSGLIDLAQKAGDTPLLLISVQNINSTRPGKLIEKLKKVLGSLEDKKIAVWGLSFKPDTDDMRFAPSIPLIMKLVDEKVLVSAFDPKAGEKAKPLLPHSVTVCDDMYEAAKDCDALVIVTEWDIFKTADFEALKKIMRKPVIVDGRNIYSKRELKLYGFNYQGLGQ